MLTGIDLPTAYEVHFSNNEHGISKTMIGDSSGVSIPDEYLKTGAPIYVWLFAHSGEDDGETEYRAAIQVIKRARPTDEQPTQEEAGAIGQAIAALNQAVETTGQDVIDALAAQGLAEAAQEAAETAQRKAEEA